MDFDTEILVRLHWRDVPMRWLKTRVHYPPDGVSHFRLGLDNVLMVTLHLRLLCGMHLRLPLLVSRKFRGKRSSSRAAVAESSAADVHRRWSERPSTMSSCAARALRVRSPPRC